MPTAEPLPPKSTIAAVAAGVFAVNLLAFGPMLRWPFTDADAWPDVAWAGRPFADQLLVRLTGGVAGNDANFWRPAVMIQFWAERRLFGWNAAGWHAWDLAEHTLAAVLAGLVAATSARVVGAPWRALFWATALVFAAYPLTEDVVPAVARSIDLLLGVGVFGALVALAVAQAGRRAAWVAHTLAVAVALGAKESAVLLAPLAFAWVLLFRSDLAARPRLRAAVLAALPAAALTVAWLAVRARVLAGVGGYTPDLKAEWIVPAMQRGLVEPIFPAFAHAFPPGWVTVVPVLGVAAGAFGAGWRSPHRRLVAFGAGWFLAANLLHAVTGTLSRRVEYVPTLPLLLVFVPAAVHLARWRLGAVVAGVWGATLAYGSPLFAHSTQWAEVAEASERYRDADFWARLPVGAHVWLAERPFRADLDPRTFRWHSTNSLHHGAPAYAVQAWLDEALPARRLTVDTLTGTVLRTPLAAQAVTVRVDGDTLVVDHPGAERQDWDIRSPFRVVSAGTTLRITPRKPDEDDVVVVWTPQGPVAWTPGTHTLTR